MVFVLQYLVLLYCSISLEAVLVNELFTPEVCDITAQASDHILVEYAIKFQNGSVAMSVKRPHQLYHIQLDPEINLPLISALEGMCLNGTRRLTWKMEQNSAGTNDALVAVADMRPIKGKYRFDNELIHLDITLNHITTAADYQIFGAFKNENYSMVLDLIEKHVGINSVDEWGQTPLMISTVTGNLLITSALLNTGRPKANVNIAKSSGFTALFYALDLKDKSIFQALLRRGADPNTALVQEGSIGNTPLHFACLGEKTKHVELLLEYGANPRALNQYGQHPFQMIPSDALQSTKLYYRKLFKDAYERQQSALLNSTTTPLMTTLPSDGNTARSEQRLM